MDDDDARKKQPPHEIGMALDSLSVNELEARILTLSQEIARLEAAIAQKKDSKSLADSFFKS